MMRIVSLVPSLTHAICDFDLRTSVVGCTQFCISPTGLRKSAQIIGGTKDPDIEAISALKPTHILVNEEENKSEHIAACQAIAPTFLSFPKSPQEVPSMLRNMGAFLDVKGTAERWALSIERELDRLQESRRQKDREERRFIYYIWREPYMTVSVDTYISAMLALAGWQNAVLSATRYPELTVDEARALRPSLLLLSSEPYPFRWRDLNRLKGEWEGGHQGTSIPPAMKADGQLFSWFGTMTLAGLIALRHWLRGEPQSLIADFSEPVKG